MQSTSDSESKARTCIESQQFLTKELPQRELAASKVCSLLLYCLPRPGSTPSDNSFSNSLRASSLHSAIVFNVMLRSYIVTYVNQFYRQVTSAVLRQKLQQESQCDMSQDCLSNVVITFRSPSGRADIVPEQSLNMLYVCVVTKAG